MNDGLTKEQKGDLIATSVWEWLQNQKRIQYVPWVIDPKSPQYDAQKAAAQTSRDELLGELEKLILDTCRSCDNSAEPIEVAG